MTQYSIHYTKEICNIFVIQFGNVSQGLSNIEYIRETLCEPIIVNYI